MIEDDDDDDVTCERVSVGEKRQLLCCVARCLSVVYRAHYSCVTIDDDDDDDVT